MKPIDDYDSVAELANDLRELVKDPEGRVEVDMFIVEDLATYLIDGEYLPPALDPPGAWEAAIEMAYDFALYRKVNAEFPLD